VARLSKHWSDVALFLTESGRRGRRLALSLRPRLIVIDDQLPDFDGLDLLQQLRHVSVTASTPIITVAAHPARMDRFIQAGATVWVEKPVCVCDIEKVAGQIPGLGADQ
jgi:DNA-binding response OmpR family regulator